MKCPKLSSPEADLIVHNALAGPLGLQVLTIAGVYVQPEETLQLLDHSQLIFRMLSSPDKITENLDWRRRQKGIFVEK